MDPESKVISLVSQFVTIAKKVDSYSDNESDFETEAEGEAALEVALEVMSLFTQIISVVSSMDLDSQQQKPEEAELVSVIKQIIHCGRSISSSEPEWELISLVTRMISLISSLHTAQEPECIDRMFFHLKTTDSASEFLSLMVEIFSQATNSMDSDSELGSLLARIRSLVDSMDLDSELKAGELEQLISVSPQFEVRHVDGKLRVRKKVQPRLRSKEKWNCKPGNWTMLRLTRGTEITHFHCPVCNGKDHEEEHHKAPLEIKHPLHPRHPIQLFMWESEEFPNRQCYCCDEHLLRFFYYCWACDCAINIACVEKSPILSIDHPKWHEHTLAMYPLPTFLVCNLCSLSHFLCPFYICPPCDFVAHRSCLTLPLVIRISRHLHRLSFTPSFHQGDWSCRVCRKPIHNDYGCYSCIHQGCSYAAHSKCATQSNIWDGKELEGIPEEDDDQEEVEPFLRISNGIIQHFSHQQHHLKLDDNANIDYDENRLCQACITPIYFGNFYSCMECDFILHEECANVSRKIQHPIHPHLLTLVTVAGTSIKIKNSCSACPWLCTAGFFYVCGEEGCHFKLHLKCATVSEPLVHVSHMHPLFLTSKPGERRRCGVCKDLRPSDTNETFNCLECDFSLCFGCATKPQKVRYKHDKHTLNLSYGKETSTSTYWCEACETEINPKGGFYQCSKYCCVTLHIECLIGRDLYMNPGSSWLYYGGKVEALPNNHRMSRKFCRHCMLRCPYKIVFRFSGRIFCSTLCMLNDLGNAFSLP